MQETLVLLKPHAFKRKCVGQMLARLEAACEILEIEMIRAGVGLCKLHYCDHVNKEFYPDLEAYMTSGPILAVAVAPTFEPNKPRNVQEIREICMEMRNDFRLNTDSITENLVHCSDSEQAAAREMELWFPGWLR